MNPLLQALEYVGGALDKPGRAVRGGLAGRPDELAAIIPFSDSLEITDPSRAVSGTDLLRGAGFGTGSDTADAVLGFGAEMALDPTNLIGLGLAGKTARLAGEARAANAVRDALIAKGAMPEEIAALTKVRTEAGPLRTYHGTASPFGEIDPRHFDKEALYGPGYYTTADPEIASSYALDAMNGPQFQRKYLEGNRDTIAHNLETAIGERGSKWRSPEQQAHMEELFRQHLAEAEAKLAELPPHAPNVRTQYLDVRNPFDAEATYTPDQSAAILGGSIDDAVRAALAEKGSIGGQELYKLLDYHGGGKGAANEMLNAAGYDAIAHEGGKVLGGPSHQVYIAFDPSQVYRPWLAPAARDVPSMNPLLAGLAGYNAANAAY